MSADPHGSTDARPARSFDGPRVMWMRLSACLQRYLRAIRGGGRWSSTIHPPASGSGTPAVRRAVGIEVESFETTLRGTIERDGPSGSAAHTTFRRLGEARPLVDEVGYELTSVVSHGLRNAFKHAEAASIDLLLDYSHGDLEITIRDDGKGFDPLALSQGSRQHWGLLAMQERVAALGGICEVASTPGKGTSIFIRMAGRLAYERLRPTQTKV